MRSQCTVVCKWTYVGHEKRWDESYLSEIGLNELVEDGMERIGKVVLPVGQCVGGLTPQVPLSLFSLLTLLSLSLIFFFLFSLLTSFFLLCFFLLFFFQLLILIIGSRRVRIKRGNKSGSGNY